IAQIAFEFLSILFAVLLALGLNSLKESIDSDNEANTLKVSILKECAENQLKVDSLLINNQDYFNYLDSLIRLDPDDIESIPFQYNLELLTNAAWVIAQNNSSINNLDQDFLVSVAEIYQSQEFFTEFSRSFFENFGSYLSQQDDVTPHTMAISLYFNLNVMNGTARSLQEEYRNLLTKHPVETPTIN
ncbi:MAG: hypothetical protein AAFY41_07675, partial [Bacteroidota bacterium]